MLSISPFDKKTLSLFKRPIILKFIRFTLCIVWLVWAIIPCVQAQPQGTPPGSDSLALTDIWIRDPYLLADSATQTYYLFGTTSSSQKPGSAGFDLYTSRNLQTWQGPYPIFRPFPGFWGSKNYWAPECSPTEENTTCLPPFTTPQPNCEELRYWLRIVPKAPTANMPSDH